MEAISYNRNKAMVVTLVVHVSIVLLMLLSFRSCVRMDDIQTASGGVEVSFGQPNMGGDDAISESSSEESDEPADEPDPNPTPVDDQPTVTNKDSETAVKKTTKKTVKKKKNPEIDPRLKKSLKNIGKKKTGEDNTIAGDGKIKGQGGNEDADNKGPGGSGKGKLGQGLGLSLAGFGHDGIETPENNSQKFGKVVLEICVNSKGDLVGEPTVSGLSTTLDAYLIRITKDAIKNVKFTPKGNVKNLNCGHFSANYEKH